MKRPAYILSAIIICVTAFMVYFTMLPPASVMPMGDEASATIAWISLGVAVLSLASAVVGLIQKLVDLRAVKRD